MFGLLRYKKGMQRSRNSYTVSSLLSNTSIGQTTSSCLLEISEDEVFRCFCGIYDHGCCCVSQGYDLSSVSCTPVLYMTFCDLFNCSYSDAHYFVVLSYNFVVVVVVFVAAVENEEDTCYFGCCCPGGGSK